MKTLCRLWKFLITGQAELEWLQEEREWQRKRLQELDQEIEARKLKEFQVRFDLDSKNH